MALITCPDCQAQVSDAAPACPKCGRPMAAAAPVAAPVAVQNVVTTRPETSMVTWGCALLVALPILLAIAGALSKGCG